MSDAQDVYVQRFIEWFSRNGTILWPAIGVFGAVMLLAGIIQAFSSKELRGLEKTEMSREVLAVLKQLPGGAAGDELARRTGIEPLQLVQVLDELQRRGQVVSFTTTQRLTVWRLKEFAS